MAVLHAALLEGFELDKPGFKVQLESIGRRGMVA